MSLLEANPGEARGQIEHTRVVDIDGSQNVGLLCERGVQKTAAHAWRLLQIRWIQHQPARKVYARCCHRPEVHEHFAVRRHHQSGVLRRIGHQRQGQILGHLSYILPEICPWSLLRRRRILVLHSKLFLPRTHNSVSVSRFPQDPLVTTAVCRVVCLGLQPHKTYVRFAHVHLSRLFYMYTTTRGTSVMCPRWPCTRSWQIWRRPSGCVAGNWRRCSTQAAERPCRTRRNSGQ